MTLSSDERIERAFRREAGRALMEALEKVPNIRPMRCKIHDQPLASCNEEENGCTVEDSEPYEGAVLAEFAVVVDWILPVAEDLGDDRVAGFFFAPNMPYTHKIGLIQAVADQL